MKKLYFFLLFMLLCTMGAFAQTPEKLSYQAIVRNASDKILANQAVGVQISILQNGSSVYTETHNATTNANGLINLEVGAGTQQSGAFGTINWGSDTYFIKTEIDVTGGTNYTISGTSQLVSVPYALHAKTAETFTGTLTETDPSFNASAAKNISASDITNWNQKEDKLPTGGTQGQVLGIDNGSYTWVTPATASDTQDLSLTGNEINLTDGGSVDISTATAVVANTAKVGITSEQADAIVANTAKVGITSEQADAIVANTAKVGITSEQADAIVANTAKVGITSEQANAIVANTAKVGITSEQADAIVANTAKVGISSEQADAIVANTAKVGITSEQADAIVANTAKVGITSEQADAIVANTAKVGITSEQADAIVANTAKVGITSEQADAIVENTSKVGITSEQADAIVANTAKVGITSEQADAIVANTAKVGITSEQADAIVANTAKVGITSEQADAIVANTAKVGITSEQADAIVANTAKVGITSEQADAIVANTAKVGITSEQATAISDNTAALANKVDKDGAKGLSTNDFTTADKSKLDGIDAGAQVNVKPDWNAATGNVAEILNKPIIPAAADGSETKVNGSTSITVSGTGTAADPYVITTTANGAMVADMKISARTADHNGWLVCDGRLVSTTTYATLFGIVGYSYGGSGSTFKLPDLRGRVAGGIGQGSGLTNRVIGANVGAETHVLTMSEMPSHNHNFSDPGHSHTIRGSYDYDNGGQVFSAYTKGTNSSLDRYNSSNTSYTGINFSAQGGNSAHNNMQPTQFVGNYFIYAGQ
jgi:microcystin-dependent protein/3-methyladenine DNA glycosylase Mpg